MSHRNTENRVTGARAKRTRLNPTRTRQRKTETRAFLQRVWQTGIARNLELPAGGLRVRRFSYHVLHRALTFRRDSLLWPGQDSEQDDRAVLNRVAGLLMFDRCLGQLAVVTADLEPRLPWENPSLAQSLAQIETLLGIGAVVAPGERALGETHPSRWHAGERRYLVHSPVRDAIAQLEADETLRPYVARARKQRREEAAETRERGEQLDKELAEGKPETGAAKLRDLVRTMRTEGRLPYSKPPDESSFS